MSNALERTVIINALPSAVWQALTVPSQMSEWMGEPQMRVQVATDWMEGSRIVISGFHHANFQNTGTILRFDPERLLRYTHLSSLSRLPPTPENHSVIEF